MEKSARFHEKPSELVDMALLAEFFGVGTHFRHETKLESVLLDQICEYLLNLKDYYIDLVFYYSGLKRTILIDLVPGKITCQHLGQMNMYVNMFDHLGKGKDDQPTIGLVLGSEWDQESLQYSFVQDSDHRFMAWLADFEGLKKAMGKGWQRALIETKDSE